MFGACQSTWRTLGDTASARTFSSYLESRILREGWLRFMDIAYSRCFPIHRLLSDNQSTARQRPGSTLMVRLSVRRRRVNFDVLMARIVHAYREAGATRTDLSVWLQHAKQAVR